MTYDDYVRSFNEFVTFHKLEAFYPPGSSTITDLARKAPAWVAAIKQQIGSQEVATQMIHLALYKLVILLDDSGSMQWNGGSSIRSLKNFLNIILKISSIYLEEGVSIRWLNSPAFYDGVRNDGTVDNIVNWNPFHGWTKIGQVLRYKILDPLVIQPAYNGWLQKPVVVMIITDGEPAGEPRDTMRQTIIASQAALRNQTRYGESAVEYQIAHVGNNPQAIEFLRSLDTDPQVGKYLDVTSEEGIEKAEVLKHSGEELTPELWVAKLMLGPVEEYFDQLNETV